jgi:hypothetical protein
MLDLIFSVVGLWSEGLKQSRPSPPASLVTPTVSASNHNDFLVPTTINQAVRKPTHPRSSELPRYDLVLKWVALNCRQSGVNGSEKIITETGTAALVPHCSLANLDRLAAAE